MIAACDNCGAEDSPKVVLCEVKHNDAPAYWCRECLHEALTDGRKWKQVNP